MIINKINNSYIIKLLKTDIDIYNPIELEKLTTKILKKINRNNKLKKLIILEIYQDINYGIIIKLNDYHKFININNETEVKINIHPNSNFLYKIDYFNINTKNPNNINIYYYQNNFYIEIKKSINKKEYLNIIEQSEIIYEEDEIITNGIKINI